MTKLTSLVSRPLVFLFLFFNMQVTLHGQNIAKRIIASNGDSVAFLQYTPAGHNAPGNTRKYPLIIFLHGGGERNNNASLTPGSPVWALEGVNNTNASLDGFGPSRLVRLGHKMNFTWNGKTDSMAVISPLSRLTKRTAPNQGSYINVWPAEYVQGILDYAIDSLQIDTNRIYLTGLSYGGGGTFNFLNSSLTNVKKLAAAAPICAWLTGLNANGHSYVANSNLPLWGFHAIDDPTSNGSYTVTQNSINGVNALNPSVKALFTLWPDGQHYIWPRVYNIDYPAYAYGYDGIINIYEWFLGQNNDSLPNILPIARAGNDTTIYTSSGVANLNASASTDADGTLVRYVWRKISGPAVGTIATPFGTASSTTVSGLTTIGVYQYQLNVVDHRAAIARDTITITVVNPASSGKALSINSTGGRILAGNVSQLKNSAAFTVEAQFQYDGTIGDWSTYEATILRSYISATDRLRLYVDKPTKSVRFVVANGSDVRGQTASNVVSPDTWYHIAAVFDGAQTDTAKRMKIYINGVQQAITYTGAAPASTSASTPAVNFGGEPSCCRVTLIDEVRVWDTVLAADTINTWKHKSLGSCHPAISKLKVYWPLDIDTNAAKAVAALGTNYPGAVFYSSYVNATLPVDTTPCTVDSGKAVHITSAGGRIIAGNISQLKNSSAFTIEAHFKFDSIVTDWTNTEATIFRSHITATDRIKLTVDKTTRAMHFVVANGTDVRGYTPSNVLTHGIWHHVAAVFDGVQSDTALRMKIYINGVSQPLTYTGAIPANTSGSNLAGMFGGEPSYSKLTAIDEVRVWDTALAAGTIQLWKDTLLNSCHPNFNRLRVYWPLDVDTNTAKAVAALGTSYGGNVYNATYIASDQVTDTKYCPSPRIAQTPAAPMRRLAPRVNSKLYPNPTEGLVQITLPAPVAKQVSVNVLDITGRYVWRNSRPLVKGNNQLSLNIGGLPRGIYIIEVVDGRSLRERYTVMKR